jgi:phosphatidylglycerol---prolipoprotein diacylglyceryl transferase
VLPFINLPDLHLWKLPIHWFGILVAIGVLVGIWLARKRAKFMGIEPDKLESMINWMLLVGFISAHVLDEIFYHPEEIAKAPWSLFFIWEGISSFGGLIGALIGILLWKRFKNEGRPLLPYADLILSVYPIAWVFGRLGCSVVHDHKGAAAPASIFTVAFPDGPHYDLGLLEMLYTVLISIVVMLMWRRKWPTGTYIGVTAVMYAPVRFFLDFLRLEYGNTGDRRYFDLTFAQYGCIVLFIFGVYLLVRAVKLARSSPG